MAGCLVFFTKCLPLSILFAQSGHWIKSVKEFKVSPDIGHKYLIQVVGVVALYVESVGKNFFPDLKRFSDRIFALLLGWQKLYLSSRSCFEH